MVCSGSKTKLLILGTSQLRRSLLNGSNISISVCGSTVQDSKSERLLGLTVNNQLTWSEYLHGEKWRDEDNSIGLIPQLNQRVGLLSKLVNLMPKDKFKLFCNGLFYSKLLYCLHVFSHVWDIPNLDQESRRFTAFTRGDNRKLQVLQNKVMRLQSGLPFRTSTLHLTEATGDLSVQQMTAHTTLVTAQRSIYFQTPHYLSDRLQVRTHEGNPALPVRHLNTLQIQSNLTLARSSFFCRASALFNQLPHNMRDALNPKQFKKKSKAWVKRNIQVRPG